MSNFELSEQEKDQNQRKYDDINYEKRCQLIQLIQEEKWTIKAAAKQIGIKLCTAKHILYLYRKKGKIYRKKGELSDQSINTAENVNQAQTFIPVFFIPYPVYLPAPKEGEVIQNQNQEVMVQQGQMPRQFGAFRPYQ